MRQCGRQNRQNNMVMLALCEGKTVAICKAKGYILAKPGLDLTEVEFKEYQQSPEPALPDMEWHDEVADITPEAWDALKRLTPLPANAVAQTAPRSNRWHEFMEGGYNG